MSIFTLFQFPPSFIGHCRRTWRRRVQHGMHRLRLEALETRTLLSSALAADPLLIAMAAAAAGHKDAPDGPYTKAGPQLAQLYAQYEQALANGTAATFLPSNPFLHIQGGRVLVDAVASGRASDLAADLARDGAQITGTYERFVSAWLPLDAISAAAQLGSLKFAQPSEMMVNAGLVQAQGDKVMYSDVARAANHVDGSGFTVGILSDSFNTSGNGHYSTDVISGDLPGDVNNVQDYSDPTPGWYPLDDPTDEGRAMAQIVHDVAPGANIDFHTAYGGMASFANGITALANAGANVIVDDVFYYAEPFFQDGPIAQAANKAYGSGHAYFSAADNFGTQSYEANFKGGTTYGAGAFTSAPGAPLFDGGIAHNFATSGYNDRQSFTLAPSAQINLTFCWQQPNFSISGGSGCQVDMDIYILDSTNRVVAGDTTNNIGGDAEAAMVQWQNPSTTLAQTYQVMLVEHSHNGNATPGLLKYVNEMNSADTMQNLAFATRSSTSVGHPNAENVQAVGAVYYQGTPRYGVNLVTPENFSSLSGCPLLFDTSGNPIHDVKDQNNFGLLVAPDGVDNSFFGHSDSDNSGFLNFYGTSAAAPHVAAVAALMDQAAGYALDPFNTYYYLEHTAADIGTSGFDWTTGFGLVDAQAVVDDIDSGAGSWAALSNAAPGGTGTMLLLPDGSAMVQHGGVSNEWYRLTPNLTGSYVHGNWSQLASMNTPRLYAASQVLPDGRVMFLGGHYFGSPPVPNNTNTGEIYNPVNNTWTGMANFPQNSFGDGISEMLPNGQVLAGYIAGPQTYLYDPVLNTWTQTGTKLHGDNSGNESWVKLADGSILSYDISASIASGINTSQRYIPSTGQWVDAGIVPVALTSASTRGYMGPALLLPDGRAFFLGSTGKTAFYDPSDGTWYAGPAIPNGLTAAEAPGAVLANGDVLFAAAPSYSTSNAPSPTAIFLFNPRANSYINVTPPDSNLNEPSYVTRMLALPSGQVLLTDGSGRLYVYTPGGAPAPTAQPVVSRIDANGDGSFTVTGTQLNGFSEGAAFGNDAQMSSNYPIVQLTDFAANVHYARTYNWSTTGVDTGNTPVWAQFLLPGGISPGAYYLSVIANGIASTPVLAVFTTSGSDSVTVNGNPLGGLAITVNSTVYRTLPGDVSAVDLVNVGGNDTTTVLATPAGVSLHISGFGSDIVNLGSGSVQNIGGDVSIENQPAFTTINVDDSANPVAYATPVSLNSFTPPGDTAFGSITGLAPGTISYEYADTQGITVHTGTARSAVVNVLAAGKPLSIIGHAAETVNIGNATNGVQSIAADVTVTNPPSFTTLNINDTADTMGQTATITSGAVSGLAGGAIHYEQGDLSALNIDGGSGGNTFYITSTPTNPNGVTTDLSSGSGSNLVNVEGTNDALTVDGGSGAQVVYVGSKGFSLNGTLANIQGPVLVENTKVNGYSYLYADDSGDARSQTWNLNYDQLTCTGLPSIVNWVARGPRLGGVTYFQVLGGSAANTINVNSTGSGAYSYITDVYTGTAGAAVNVRGTLGTLQVINQGGTDYVYVGSDGIATDSTMTTIQGNVKVLGPGATYLYLGDSGDTASKTVNLSAGSLMGLSTGNISWTATSSASGGVIQLEVRGSGAGSTYTISNTNAFYHYTSLQTGSNTDTVNVQATAPGSSLYVYNYGGSDTVTIGSLAPTLGGSLTEIKGAVHVTGTGLATTALIADAAGDNTVHTATVTDTSLTGLGNPAAIYYEDGVTAFTIRGGHAADTYNIQATRAGTSITINGGTLNDTFNVGSNTGATSTLNGIAGNLTINGGTGTNTINARDGGQTTGQNYTLSSSTLNGSDFTGTIGYASAKLILTQGSGNDGLTVAGATVPTGVTVNGDGGTNTLTGPDLASTWTINGPNAGFLSAATKLAFSYFQALVGGSATDTFKFTATGSLASTINGGSGSTVNKLDYSGDGGVAVTVNLQTQAAPKILGGAAAGFSNIQSLVGSTAADTLIGPNATTAWSITATNGGKAGTFVFTGVENLVGGTATDTFKFSNGKGVSGTINGGSGTNTLDYSLYLAVNPVTVNLATGVATNTGGISNFQNVYGGAGGDKLTGNASNNLLRGNAGNDTIAGGGGSDIVIGGDGNDTLSVPLGSGRSILIGSKGADNLTGGNAGDILIGGYTSYDTNTAANNTGLLAILGEWTSGTDSYGTRIAKIRAGLPGGYKFSATTVHDDRTADVLTGKVNYPANPDWFWAGVAANPDAKNNETGEQVN